MHYDFIDNAGSRTFLLFHGTGGSKEDLVPLAKHIDPTANIVAFEGDVSERGMRRFFKRKSPGVFDVEDLKKRSKAALKTIETITDKHGLNQTHLIAIGYSNGANLIASTLYVSAGVFEAVFLHHPMIPYESGNMMQGATAKAFIGAGENDPICPKDHTTRVESLLEDCGAKVCLHWHAHGHSLTQGEADAAKKYYDDEVK